MTDPNLELDELRETVRLLMAENQMLAERAEDTLLLGLIAEQIGQTGESEQMISIALEQIGLLKDLPVCMFWVLEADRLLCRAAYLAFSEQEFPSAALDWSPAMMEALGVGAHVFVRAEGEEPDWVKSLYQVLERLNFQATGLALIPFQEQMGQIGFFLFADSLVENRLREMLVLLNRVVEMVIERRNNLYLIQALRQANRQLHAAVNELEAFSYSVSHDLRAPLRAINGFAVLMAESYTGQLPEEALQDLGHIQDAALRMSALIDGLLQFSRLSRKSMVYQPVDLAVIVREVWADLEAERHEREVIFTLSSLPVTAGDPLLLRQVLFNLLSNAVKFTRRMSPARIEVGFQPAPVWGAPDELQADYAGAYYVRDNGVGFDMRYANNLFGVFQRLHSTDEFEGTGVGLAITRRVIERHGGWIWAQAEVDQGATFYFVLGQSPKAPVGMNE